MDKHIRKKLAKLKGTVPIGPESEPIKQRNPKEDFSQKDGNIQNQEKLNGRGDPGHAPYVSGLVVEHAFSFKFRRVDRMPPSRSILQRSKIAKIKSCRRNETDEIRQGKEKPCYHWRQQGYKVAPAVGFEQTTKWLTVTSIFIFYYCLLTYI